MLIFGAIVLAASSVLADQVHLAQGQVLEGKATIEGDKVVIELESGRITVPTSEVVKIDRGTTPLAEANARDLALKPGDVAGLLSLANFCRDHDLFNKEHDALARIVASSPNHAEARRRLGFVRDSVNGREVWVDKAELQRREQAARLERGPARATLDSKQPELSAAQLKVQQDRARAQQEDDQRTARDNSIYALRSYNMQPSAYGYGGPYGYGYGGAYGYGYGSTTGYAYGSYARSGPPHLSPPSGGPGSGINGVRSPSDTSFSIPGVRAPESYFNNAGPSVRHH